MTNNPRIVVGVDGSALSTNALEFAIEETQLRHGHLHVTYAYPSMEKPVTGSTGKDYYEQVEAEARTFMEGIMSSAPSTEGNRGRVAGRAGQPRRGPHRGQQRGGVARRRFTRRRRIQGPHDGFGLHAVRPPLALSGARRARRPLRRPTRH
jgi:hypothetical protein